MKPTILYLIGVGAIAATPLLAQTREVPPTSEGRPTVITHFGKLDIRKQSAGTSRKLRFVFDNKRVSGAYFQVGMSVRFGSAKSGAGIKGVVPVALSISYSTENRPGTWTVCRTFSHLYVRGAPGVDFEVTCLVTIRPGRGLCQGVWFRFESAYFKPELLEMLEATYVIDGIRRQPGDADCSR